MAGFYLFGGGDGWSAGLGGWLTRVGFRLVGGE